MDVEPALPDLLSPMFLTQTVVLHSKQPAGLPEETQGILGTGSLLGRPHLETMDQTA